MCIADQPSAAPSASPSSSPSEAPIPAPSASPSSSPSAGYPSSPSFGTPAYIQKQESACIAIANAFPQLQTLTGDFN